MNHQHQLQTEEEKAIREHDKQEENTRLYYLTQVPFVSSYGGLIGDCMFYGHGDVGESSGKYKGAKIEHKIDTEETKLYDEKGEEIKMDESSSSSSLSSQQLNP